MNYSLYNQDFFQPLAYCRFFGQNYKLFFWCFYCIIFTCRYYIPFVHFTFWITAKNHKSFEVTQWAEMTFNDCLLACDVTEAICSKDDFDYVFKGNIYTYCFSGIREKNNHIFWLQEIIRNHFIWLSKISRIAYCLRRYNFNRTIRADTLCSSFYCGIRRR